jgi:hypothetical protein
MWKRTKDCERRRGRARKIEVSSIAVRCIAFALLSLLACEVSQAQGGWDIRYVSSDVIDSSMLGKEVRIDFRRSAEDTVSHSEPPLWEVHGLLFQEDTVELMIGTERMLFAERWDLHVDMGYVSYQYLESVSPAGRIIGGMTLLRIEQDSLHVEADVRIDDEQSDPGVPGVNKTVEIAIGRAAVKGIVFKKD